MKHLLTTLPLLFFCSQAFSDGYLVFQNKASSLNAENQNVAMTTENLDSARLPETVLHLRGGTNRLDLRANEKFGNFNYDKGLDASVATLGIESTSVRIFGKWGWRGDLGYSTYENPLPESKSGLQRKGLVKLDIIPVTASIVYLADFSPKMKWLMPAVTGGLGYYFLHQTGGIDSGKSSNDAWLWHASLGVRHSLDWTKLNNLFLSFEYVTTSPLWSTDVDLSSKMLLLGLASKI